LETKVAELRVAAKEGDARKRPCGDEGVNEMKLTKGQLKGIIEQTVKNLISEKDADGDGSPAPPKWADPDDNDPKVKASLQKEQEADKSLFLLLQSGLTANRHKYATTGIARKNV
jgi:hypothetical protein